MSVQMDNQDHVDCQVLMATLEPPVHLESEETRGFLDQLEIRAFKDHLDHEVPRALRGPRDALVIPDLQDPKETQEHLVYKAHKEQMELQDQLDRLVLLGLQDKEVIRDQEANQGQMAPQALQDPLGLQDFQEMLVH